MVLRLILSAYPCIFLGDYNELLDEYEKTIY